ncbi:MAG: CdaR family protein [Acetobacter sp.]|nr:CdaR family protein [Bacteroides sp.]MCM1341344.1 CdaR family protein [Acetobacter sp.]MCM1433436.1 CdaR family protein [Clostridiales bacterium]
MAEKKKKSFSLRKLIYNDKYLIIISIILAIVIWIVTSMNLSPETTKTITVSVPVDFSESAAEQLGLKCYGDESFDVDVTVKCKKYLAKDITGDDINVSLQTNYVTSSGNIDVPVKVDAGENSDFEVQSYYPATYKAYFDVEQEKVLDVDIKYDNMDFAADGYIIGQPLLNESSLTVRGPKAYVSQVEKILCDVSFKNQKLTTTENITVTPLAVDLYGSDVRYISLLDSNGEKINSLDLTIPVLKQTVLPVSVEFLNKPSNINPNMFDIKYSLNKVDAGVLDSVDITSAVIGQVDFSKLNLGENEFNFNVQNLDSLLILNQVNEIKVTLTVPSNYKSKGVSVMTDNIKITNLPEEYKYEIIGISSNRVTAIGTEKNLESINTKNIALNVNVLQNGENLEEKTYTFNAVPFIEGSGDCWIYGDYTVDVRIYK